MKELEKIESVCPACYQEGKIHKIAASVIEEDGKVWITKKCKKHGSFKDIYFSDADVYKKWIKYKVTGESAPDVKTTLFNDPPLYTEHKSQTVLTNLMATNRCNLRCSYCFMNAGAAGYVYEPALDQLRDLMIQARTERPMGSKAIQITGGEPNMDIVRGVNFQPISFCGRVTKIKDEKRDLQRVDYVQMMAEIEKEFDGQISRDDFFPVPFVFPISKLIELLKGEIQVEFTAHPGCGGATYIFYNDGMPIPITRFIDAEGLLSFVNKQSGKKGPLKKLRVAASFLKNIDNFVDYDKAPKGFDLKQILKDAAIGGSYDSLRGFHYKSLFVGSMWFQDAWNLNVDRLQRCVIHYTTLEGIVPFCSYNGLGYGDKIREKHSIPIKEWEKKTGKKIKEDLRKDIPLT